MPTYFSPTGNPEAWEEKPSGYFTPEEWAHTHPVPQPTPEELAEAAKQRRLSEIAARLAEIDLASVRPLRTIAQGVAAAFDREKLATLEEEAETLREERTALL
jgi:hypothetical protein